MPTAVLAAAVKDAADQPSMRVALVVNEEGAASSSLDRHTITSAAAESNARRTSLLRSGILLTVVGVGRKVPERQHSPSPGLCHADPLSIFTLL